MPNTSSRCRRCTSSLQDDIKEYDAVGVLFYQTVAFAHVWSMQAFVDHDRIRHKRGISLIHFTGLPITFACI
jgi:hypothetical protein